MKISYPTKWYCRKFICYPDKVIRKKKSRKKGINYHIFYDYLGRVGGHSTSINSNLTYRYLQEKPIHGQKIVFLNMIFG